jgi:hypothetical protein
VTTFPTCRSCPSLCRRTSSAWRRAETSC